MSLVPPGIKRAGPSRDRRAQVHAMFVPPPYPHFHGMYQRAVFCHSGCTSAARPGDCIGTPNGKQESKMSKRAGALSAGLTILALAGSAMVSLGTSPAQ